MTVATEEAQNCGMVNGTMGDFLMDHLESSSKVKDDAR